MKKTVLIIMSIISLVSCNNEKEIKIVEPPKEIILNVIQNIDGDVGSFCYAKNEKIKISFKKVSDQIMPGFEYSVPIKINFTNSSDIKAGRGYNDYGPSLEIEFLDKEGKKIEDCFANMTISYTDLASLIKSGNREEWINFEGTYYVNSLEEDNSFEESKAFIANISKAASIRIKSKIIEEKVDSNSNDSGVSESTSSSGSADCDKLLNEYEEIVMDYIEIAKKAKENPNDISYMSDLADFAEKAKNLENDINQCKDDSKVVNRIVELQQKMVNAMR
jgi:hypothetical protein